ncbi:MAG: Uma2 family endonuclease [Verrucomicrobia bacterium]|nr:Uma2 family endonuclease [Leptolyngbya sp. ES-bin-22]
MLAEVCLTEIRLITVAEYHKMAEAGILDSDERVELIDGQILKMAAKGTAHSSATTRTEKLLEQRLEGQAWIRVQEPIRLNNYSEPEPDVAVVQIDPLDYADHHPIVPEVYLVIEVADSSLRADCEFKSKVYARSGITDYWVLDVVQRTLHVFREPTQTGYQTERVLLEDATIAPLQFPDVTIAIAAMLPKFH